MRTMKQIRLSILLVLVGLTGIPCQAQNQKDTLQKRSRAHWNRMLNILDIRLPDSLPLPAEDPDRPAETFMKEGTWYDNTGNFYTRGPWGKWTNYDEAKASPYTDLPDPLMLKNGKRVSSPKIWWQQKRPQIKRDFSREIYGRVPAHVPGVNWKIVSSEDTTIHGVKAAKKVLVGEVNNTSYPEIAVHIDLRLVTPAEADAEVPIMMHLGYDFPPGFDLPESYDAWKARILEKGWGYAIYTPTSVQPDHAAGLTKGIIGLVNRGHPRDADDWGALRAWAWGASRALDYLQSDPAVDGQKVGIEGVSRYGKAALVAMAYDQRFAIALIGSSGKGGATLYRRNFGETIGILSSSSEYHWFAGQFMRYAGPLEASDLPVDSHELIALCAPRPVFISTGSPKVEGRWMDNKGQFLAAKAASPVYELLGKEGLGSQRMPPVGTALTTGALAFRQHKGGHTAGPNWPWFLDFAEKYFSN